MTYDIQVLSNYNQSTPVSVAYATPQSLACTGPAAAAQRWMILFLSEYDAQTGRGTSFMTLLRTGQIMTDAAVVLTFATSMVQLMNQMGNQAALPADERIEGAALIAHTLFGSSLSMTVQLTLAATTITIPVPIKVV